MAILTEKKTWRRELSPEAERIKNLPRLTDQEKANVRRAIHFLRARYGTPSRLAEAMGITEANLEKLRSPSRPQTPRLAVIVARVAGVDVGDVISGAWPSECPTCGGPVRLC